MKITNHETLLTNFVLVPEKPVEPGTLNADKIKSKIIEIFGDSSKPITTQFPELMLIFDSTNQINITAEREKIIISDNKVTGYASRDLAKFTQLARAVYEILSFDKLKAYGFNIISTFETDAEDSSQFLRDKFIQKEAFGDAGELIGSAVRFIYKTKDGIRNDLRIEPKFADGASVIPQGNIQVSQNSNFIDSALPTLTDFKEKTTNLYNDLPVVLGKLI